VDWERGMTLTVLRGKPRRKSSGKGGEPSSITHDKESFSLQMGVFGKKRRKRGQGIVASPQKGESKETSGYY